MYSQLKRTRSFRKMAVLFLTAFFVIAMLPVSAYAETKPVNEESGETKTSEDVPEPGTSAVKPDTWQADTSIIPLKKTVGEKTAANGSTTVLLIQSTLPWSENTNTIILDNLRNSGYIGGYTVVSMGEAAKENFFNYSLVMLANDQTPSSYESYELIRASLEDYVYKGGSVLFGACDNGWADGNLSTTLPGGVGKYTEYSYYNYIADYSNPFVTGELTGGRALTDEMLYNNYCSHTCFYEDTLPQESLVILRSSDTNDPTLVRYNYGSGNVVATGLTWEHCYTHQDADHFSQNSYDDLMVYALSLSGAVFHNIYSPKIYAFNYSENTPAAALAEKCSLYSLLAYRDTAKNNSGSFVQKGDKDSVYYVGQEMKKDGFIDLYSYNYDGKGKTKGNAVSKEYNQNDHSILFTIGHRRIKNIDGDIQDQIAVVFRGTHDDEWYGNFDVTGTSYDETIDYHYSFQKAVDVALEKLSKYINEISATGRLNRSSISVLLTGHSRGAAVANMMAHELTDLRDGTAENSLFSSDTIKSVYAYTFATPNVATVSKIKSKTDYNNIFNYCYTDDFVPRLPLESWSWGKYGKTYWATADQLYGTIPKNEIIYGDSSIEEVAEPDLVFIGPIVGPIKEYEDNAFTKAVKKYFSSAPTYNKKYAKNIAHTASQATDRDGTSGVYNYYDKYLTWASLFDYKDLYSYMRTGLGGTMHDSTAEKMDGVSTLLTPIASRWASPYFVSLATNLIIGGAINPALNYTHQCGSYYVGMKIKFNEFKLCELTDSGYSVTPESLIIPNSLANPDNAEVTDVNDETSEVKNEAETAALQAFLNQIWVDEDGTEYHNADLLGWDINDPETWSGIIWSEDGNVTSIDLSYTGVFGTLDLSGFTSLEYLDVSYGYLENIDLTGCTSLVSLNISGNQLTELKLEDTALLKELDCSNNKLTVLQISQCVKLEDLICDNNCLHELDLSTLQNLMNLSVSYNYLDLSDSSLSAAILSIAEKGGSVSYYPQYLPEDAVYYETDVNKLKKIASFGENASILGWNLNDPSSFNGVNWITREGVYHLYEVDLSGLSLTGNADFSDCKYLTSLLISDNEFTSLNIDGCDSLYNLNCSYNCLDPDSLQAYEEGDLNVLVSPQKTPAGIQLDSYEKDLILSMNDTNGLEFREEALFYYPEITWTEEADGYYHITAVDFTDTCLAGDVDISGLSYLSSFNFAGTGIETVVLPDGITKIPDHSFENCEELYEVNFPENLVEIGSNAFKGDRSLFTLTMPASLEVIGSSAFEDCLRLLLVQFEGDEIPLGQDAFKGCRENLTLAVYFGEDSLTLRKDTEGHLNTFHFANSDSLSWSSSKPGVASVSENGTITACDDGAALISAVSDTGFSATAIIIVYHNEITQQPYGINGIEGFQVSMSVAVKGETESYQWQKSSDNVNFIDLSEDVYSGSRTDTVTFRLTRDDTENTFRCKISFTDGDLLYTELVKPELIPVQLLSKDSFSLAKTEDSDYAYFSFTPEESGTYRFYSQGEADTYADLMDLDGNILYSSDDDGYNNNFFISYNLEAGKSYILRTHLYSYGYGMFSVKVTGRSIEASRISGSDRFLTALLAAEEYKALLGRDAFENIIIASGTDFPDALVGSYLAANRKAPIVYVNKDANVINRTIDYVQNNLVSGGNVYLLGGEAAIPASVEETLTALGIDVYRLYGSNRYSTNIEILNEAGVYSGSELLVVTGQSFADALSASSTGQPMLMVNGASSELTPYQTDFLNGLGKMNITIIGGAGAVSADMEAVLSAYDDDGIIRRIAGSDRYKTSRFIAEEYFSDTSSIVLAYGMNFPDGLSAGPIASYLHAPVFLAQADAMNNAYADAKEFANERNLRLGYALGGSGLISNEAYAEIMGLSSIDEIIAIK